MGLVSGVLFHFGAQRFSPKYRSLTVQFRTFIQVAFVITGACWAIDNNLIVYERSVAQKQREERLRRMEEQANDYYTFATAPPGKKRQQAAAAAAAAAEAPKEKTVSEAVQELQAASAATESVSSSQ